MRVFRMSRQGDNPARAADAAGGSYAGVRSGVEKRPGARDYIVQGNAPSPPAPLPEGRGEGFVFSVGDGARGPGPLQP